MNRIISFSLYGSDPRYTWGAVRNARLAAVHYPDWICRFYVPEDYSDPVMADFMAMDNVEIVHFVHGCPPMMQRFLVADDLDVERFIVRDADSRISAREVEAVEQWIGEDRVLHVMRDHPAHQVIPGGMWGAMWHRSNWGAPKMEGLIRDFLSRFHPSPNPDYQLDQDFLATHVWPWAKDSMTCHDSSSGRRREIGGKSFPSPRKEWPRFVGEIFLIGENGEDVPRGGDFEQIPKDNE